MASKSWIFRFTSRNPSHPPFARSNQRSDSHPCNRVLIRGCIHLLEGALGGCHSHGHCSPSLWSPVLCASDPSIERLQARAPKQRFKTKLFKRKAGCESPQENGNDRLLPHQVPELDFPPNQRFAGARPQANISKLTCPSEGPQTYVLPQRKISIENFQSKLIKRKLLSIESQAEDTTPELQRFKANVFK